MREYLIAGNAIIVGKCLCPRTNGQLKQLQLQAIPNTVKKKKKKNTKGLIIQTICSQIVFPYSKPVNYPCMAKKQVHFFPSSPTANVHLFLLPRSLVWHSIRSLHWAMDSLRVTVMVLGLALSHWVCHMCLCNQIISLLPIAEWSGRDGNNICCWEGVDKENLLLYPTWTEHF